MKTFILFFIFHFSLVSQNYFYDEFNYSSFSEIDSLYRKNEENFIWRTNFSLNFEDISENNIIDTEELFKSSLIVLDPFNPSNKVIRLELNRIAPNFYTKYFCDNNTTNNVFSDYSINDAYFEDKDSYCIGCKRSPLGVKFNYWRNRMNRNEISTYGTKNKLYKSNKDHWFGMDMMLDEEYELEKSENPEIVTQFHVAGNIMKYPPLALRILNKRFVLIQIIDNNGKKIAYDLGPVIKNKWINWKYHINLSKKNRNSIIEIWRDGEKLHSIEGRNIYKNFDFYLKVGVYKWAWWNCTFPKTFTSKKIIYFDNIWANNTDNIN